MGAGKEGEGEGVVECLWWRGGQGSRRSWRPRARWRRWWRRRLWTFFFFILEIFFFFFFRLKRGGGCGNVVVVFAKGRKSGGMGRWEGKIGKGKNSGE